MKNEAVKYTAEYKAIQEHYADRKAERSGVPLIWHIDEGLEILELIGASKDAMRAYCLHPLFQNDEDLAKTLCENQLYVFSPRCVVLAVEYRARANDWLSEKVYKMRSTLVTEGKPAWMPLIEVKQMLIADKVQNYIDFLQYHYGKHQRSNELAHYFLEWFKVLDIDEEEYTRIISSMYKKST